MPRTWRVLALAVAFGFAAGLLHGASGEPVRATLGNLSTPWLLVAVVPAWWSDRPSRGAVVGVVATLAALTGFYLGLTLLLGGHLGSGNGAFPRELAFVVGANRVWFLAGLVSGPVCGAVASVLGRRTGRRGLTAVTGLLLVAEPAATLLAQGRHLPVVGGWAHGDRTVYLGEVALGLAVLSVVVVLGRLGSRA